MIMRVIFRIDCLYVIYISMHNNIVTHILNSLTLATQFYAAHQVKNDPINPLVPRVQNIKILQFIFKFLSLN